MQKECDGINSYFIKAKEKIDSGDVESALEYVTKLEKSEDETLANFYLAPLYIDIGAANEDETMVLDGINLIEDNFEDWSKIGAPEMLYYNLANGYLFYHDITGKRYQNSKIVLLEAKNNYKKAFLIEN